MKILVRLPNWLGDAVMAVGFLNKLRVAWPEARVEVILRRELEDAVRLLPQVDAAHSFGRDEAASLAGARRFAKRVASGGGFDRFYCLPRSFSSAWMGFFTNSRERIGYRGQWRSWALTRAYARTTGAHRAVAYAHLLHERLPDAALGIEVGIAADPACAPSGLPDGHGPMIGLNIHSEAASRRLSPERGATIADALVDAFDCTVVLVGTAAQAERSAALLAAMRRRERCADISGRTSLPQLASLMARLQAFVSVDSGPAHLANAVGTPTVALFGAGDDRVTAPWNAATLRVVRADDASCRCCLSNECRLGTPACIEDIEPARVVAAVGELVAPVPG
ncbi:MAG: glycosyltransferase family 9 protein [Vicinamibacterales bacterium]